MLIWCKITIYLEKKLTWIIVNFVCCYLDIFNKVIKTRVYWSNIAGEWGYSIAYASDQ